MAEQWRDIEGYEGLYKVSEHGKVISLSKLGSKAEMELRPFEQDGYLRYTLRKDDKGRNFLAHQLVAKAFIPNPHGMRYVDHIDTNKKNNHVSNLRWVTRKMNSNNPLTRKHNSMARRKKKSLWAKDIVVNHMIRA